MLEDDDLLIHAQSLSISVFISGVSFFLQTHSLKLIPLKSTVGPLTGSETIQILEVILRVVYVILMMEMILGGDSYKKSCW